MRRVRYTLAVIGVLCATTYGGPTDQIPYPQDRPENSRSAFGKLGNNEHYADQFQDIPVLNSHVVDPLLLHRGVEPKAHITTRDLLCPIKVEPLLDDELQEDRRHNGWCEENEHHKPSLKVTHCENAAVAVSIIPLQQMTSQQNQTLDRYEAQKSEGIRCVNERNKFDFTGQIQRNAYETQCGCDLHGEVFEEHGYGRESFIEQDCDHEVECGNFGDDSGENLLDTKIGNFDNHHHRPSKEIRDVDEDIEKKIISQVEKTISDILSDAINRCFQDSFSGIIDLQQE